MHASSSQFASASTPLHRYAPWVISAVLLLHVLGFGILMQLTVPKIEPQVNKPIQVRIVQPEVPNVLPKPPVAAVLPPKPQPKPKPEIAKLPPKIIATAKPSAKPATVVAQSITTPQPLAPVVPAVITPTKEPVNIAPPANTNNTKSAPEPVAQGPKSVSIGGDGIQWSRSPKPNYTNRDLDGKNRTVVIGIQAEANGSIQSARIKQSSGLAELDEKCLRAVRNAKFKPYKVNGTAIATVTELPLLLNLNPDG